MNAKSSHPFRSRKLRVGITLGMQAASESLWNNGIKQNAIFLAETLNLCPSVQRTVLLNTTGIDLSSGVSWDTARWPTLAFDEGKNDVDVIIELGGQLDGERTAWLKSRGVWLVSYCCGFEYIHASESVLFNRPMWRGNLFVNQRYDDIWIIPQVAGNSQPYFEILRRIPGKVVPFVWSPVLLEARSAQLEDRGVYRAREQTKGRIAVMEPNINIVKFCLYPILIAELAYRRRPNDIALLQVANADQIATHNEDFIALMNQLDIVRDSRAVFVGRHDTPEFISRYAQVVVSHQMENPLNYFYLEVAWQGYPLVHNGSLCSELGFYYEANALNDAADSLCSILSEGIGDPDIFRQQQRALLARFQPEHPDVVRSYESLLQALTSRPPR